MNYLVMPRAHAHQSMHHFRRGFGKERTYVLKIQNSKLTRTSVNEQKWQQQQEARKLGQSRARNCLTG